MSAAPDLPGRAPLELNRRDAGRILREGREGSGPAPSLVFERGDVPLIRRQPPFQETVGARPHGSGPADRPIGRAQPVAEGHRLQFGLTGAFHVIGAGMGLADAPFDEPGRTRLEAKCSPLPGAIGQRPDFRLARRARHAGRTLARCGPAPHPSQPAGRLVRLTSGHERMAGQPTFACRNRKAIHR